MASPDDQSNREAEDDFDAFLRDFFGPVMSAKIDSGIPVDSALLDKLVDQRLNKLVDSQRALTQQQVKGLFRLIAADRLWNSGYIEALLRASKRKSAASGN